MERLTASAKYPSSTFHVCQLCGHTNPRDIVEFRMWNECDEHDVPEPGNYLVICAKGKCNQILDDHPRLYVEVPWGQGGPGAFMLLCGDCTFRSGYKCTHADLKANGGDGLEVKFSNILPIRVCFTDGTSQYMGRNPAHSCAGRSGK